MSYKRWEKFIKVENYDPKEINILVNNTDENKEVMWNSKIHVIKAGEEKPMINYIIGHFIKHTLGLSVKPVLEADKRYDEFREPETEDPTIAPVKGETEQFAGEETNKKVAELEAKLDMMAKLLGEKAEAEVVSEVDKPKEEVKKEVERVTCMGKTKDGKPCKNRVVKGTKYCAPHSK